MYKIFLLSQFIECDWNCLKYNLSSGQGPQGKDIAKNNEQKIDEDKKKYIKYRLLFCC